ncbi:CG14177 [Drosophila busckii]|uniref:CG14177 n=1 Tax=Drosophila busckii TaxID=30019 RepID=A0A0M4EZ81_DROBS|nr:CG14177 [Drosophila busckii]
MHGDSAENVVPAVSAVSAVSAAPAGNDSRRSTPAALPRRPILRLDINKPRRSSGGSVDFRCENVAAGNGGGGGGGGNGSQSAQVATVASSEVSELDLLYAGESAGDFGLQPFTRAGC